MLKLTKIGLVAFALSTTSNAQTPPVRTQGSTETMVNYVCYPRASALPSSEHEAFIQKCRLEVTPQVEEMKSDVISAEQAMAEAYAKVKAKFVPRPTTRPYSSLLNAQRAWIKYREAHCAFEVEWTVGAYESNYLFAKCSLAEARKREAYLKSLLD